jgi:hypothetical protein
MSKECVPLKECNNQKTRIVRYIRTRKKNYNKNQQKQQVKEKNISVLGGGKDLFCATKCAIWKESDVPLLENHKTNVREKVKMM